LKHPISETDLISDILARSTDMSRRLSEYGLVCVNCPLNHFETLEEGAKIHGMTDLEIKKMLADLNS
jgi:hybrid cluster-associated redox disulfide protein